ncbi:MAG: hypothetical protein ACREOG_04400 [Gemmatimonadaceae bacterium]
MIEYGNLSGSSGVVAYELTCDGIIVEFAGGPTYLYNNERPGRPHVEQMKKLAAENLGLATYISRYVKDNYAKRLK